MPIQGMEGVKLTLIKGNKLMLLDPLRLKLIDLRPRRPIQLHRLQRLRQRVRLLRHAKDELMVPHIDSTTQQLAALRVRPRNDQVLAAHEIPLEARSHKPIDMLACRHQHFPSKMPALLPAVQLVLEMHGRGPVLGEQLRELQHRA